MFNVDEFGRYKGGLPQKGKGHIRGNAFGEPGVYHDPSLHNNVVDPFTDSQTVNK